MNQLFVLLLLLTSSLPLLELRVFTFYIKFTNPGRPVVSACSCPTKLISSYLDKIMASIIRSLLSYVKESHHTLQMFQFPGRKTNLFFLWWNRELTLKCKLKCYVKTLKDPLGISPSEGNQGTTRGKGKILLTSVGIAPMTSGLDLPLLC